MQTLDVISKRHNHRPLIAQDFVAAAHKRARHLSTCISKNALASNFEREKTMISILEGPEGAVIHHKQSVGDVEECQALEVETFLLRCNVQR